MSPSGRKIFDAGYWVRRTQEAVEDGVQEEAFWDPREHLMDPDEYATLEEYDRKLRVKMWVDAVLMSVNAWALKRLEERGEVPVRTTKAFWRRMREEGKL